MTILPPGWAEVLKNVPSGKYQDGFTTLLCPCGGGVFISKAPSCDGEGECDQCHQLFNLFGQPLARRAREVDYLDSGEYYSEEDY